MLLINSFAFWTIVEILMDLVDLNLVECLHINRIIVEILMDLVDLNSLNQQKKVAFYCRDPYGSRGSKCYIYHIDIIYYWSRSLWISWI